MIEKQSTGTSGRDAALTRRALLKRAAALGVGISTIGALDALAAVPRRGAARGSALPDIQFAIADFIAPAKTLDGVLVQFGPVYTMFVTARLKRTPVQEDKGLLAAALDTIEATYPFSPAGVFTCVSYGIPYFERLPGGMRGSLVRSRMPRLRSDPRRFALEEAVPGPTDVSTANPGVDKERFAVPVAIESNDMMITLRSDSTEVIEDVLTWLTGDGTTLSGREVGRAGLDDLLETTSRRLMFNQLGLPHKVARERSLPFAEALNPESPMWMGFADQQVAGSGPPEITSFAGNRSARLTTAGRGSYFGNGAIVHLSHVILDLEQFYGRGDEPYTERVQYMFRSNPIPSTGYSDQYAGGGGPAFLPNVFQGPDDAERNAAGEGTFEGERRLGHVSALQRSTRAADGTPIHIRADGPGFDALDVPDGSDQPKLHFSVFVPTADFFATMRRSQASTDLAAKYRVPAEDNGLERFLTATRRQNFLVPPRSHRAFPLLELVRPGRKAPPRARG